MRRITRKQLKGDEFVSTMDVVVHWSTENWRPVAAVIGVAALVAVGWWSALSFGTSRAEKASYQLRQAVVAYQDAQGDAARLDQARTGLVAVVDQYGSSDQADMARVYVAQIDANKGDVDAARAALVKLTDSRKGDAIGRLAMLDLIHLRVASGQAAEVAKELETMVVGADRSLPRDAALFELAEIYVKEQDPGRAKEYFQKLVEEFPESAYLDPARQRLAEIG